MLMFRHNDLLKTLSNAGKDAAPRILIVRLSALGDVVLTLPVANALRGTFPRAYIAWLVESRNAAVLQGHPFVDRVIPVAKKWLNSPTQIVRLRKNLRSEGFDIALDVQSLSRSSLAAWFSAAPVRIAFAPPQGRELAPFLATHRCPASKPHVAERFLQLLGVLGIREWEPTFDIPELAGEADWAQRTLEQMGIRGPYAVINPGAAWPNKMWCPRRFGEVARFLVRQCGLPVLVLWGNSQERQLAREVAEAAQTGEGVVVAPPTTIREMIAILRRARLMVAGDTGPIHIAAAMGVPCVGLYGPTDGEVTGPYGKQHVVVQAARHRGKHRRKAPKSLILAITVDMVCDACSRLLAHPGVHSVNSCTSTVG